MMTTCDLSGQCKPFDTAIKITANIYTELYRQASTVIGKLNHIVYANINIFNKLLSVLEPGLHQYY